MKKVRARGEDIRRFILDKVDQYPKNISKITAENFGITRQAVNKHLQRLTSEKSLTESGNTRNRIYNTYPLVDWHKNYHIVETLAEHLVWQKDLQPTLGSMPDNVFYIWQYGLTEIINNAIDHSGGSDISIHIQKTAANTEVVIADNGVGIFKKIQSELGLADERHAILELAKGKLTTDPEHHSGEGIFFSSRMFDHFNILSGGIWFSHQFGDSEDWILERGKFETGTTVWMKLNNHTARTTRKIFKKFSTPDAYGFNKTVVPVKLAQYGNDNLVSRSQAKRLLDRVDRFKVVIFDFTDVDMIGQAFADEVFRVFAQKHPAIQLSATNTKAEVKYMIERALRAKAEISY